MIEQFWKTEYESEQISKEEIENAIKKLKIGKAVGPDKINNEMIKRCGKDMKDSIIRMITLIYSEEKIPKEWHKAYIKNIYKGKGSKK